MPPRKPANRSFTVTAEKQQAQAAHDHEDFFWTYTEEPHRTRRMAIIKAHPEVRQPVPPFIVSQSLTLPGYQALRP